MIEEIFHHVSITRVLVAFVVVLSLIWFTKWINTERKIRALGGHAPRIRTYLPGGNLTPEPFTKPY
jgi:hypothetical protein